MNVYIVPLATCSNCKSQVTELIKGTHLCPACNATKMGKLQKDMLSFITRCKGWHGINKDSLTQKVARSLVNRGLIQLNEYGQIKIK